MNTLNFRASLFLLIAMFAMTLRVDGEGICADPTINAFVQMPSGVSFAFKGSQTYILELNAEAIPTFVNVVQPITSVLPGVPNNIDAAVGIGNITYFLKDSFFYEIIGGDLVRVEKIHEESQFVPNKVDAAFEDGPNPSAFFVKESIYYKYLGQTVLSGSIWDWFWPIVHPDAAFLYTNEDGTDFLYVFKGIHYYGIHTATKEVLPGFPKETGPDWFGC